MKKILILLSITLLSCDVHSPRKKDFHLKLYFLGEHTRTMTFNLPDDAELFLRPDPASLIWKSESAWCGAHVLKYNVIDFEVLKSK